MRFEACLTPLFQKTMLAFDYSPAYKDLNKKIGQANHFIITLLIGLDGIILHNSQKPEEFRTTWNPKDKKASVVRSRDFALKSSLAWAIDSLDRYLIDCNYNFSITTEPESKLFSEDKINLDDKIDSIFRNIRFSISNEKFEIFTAMIYLAALWKEKLVHPSTTNTPLPKYTYILKTKRDVINSDFCGLDILRTIESFQSNNNPTMKEVTAFIRSICGFCQILDNFTFNSELKLTKYATHVLHRYFGEHLKQKQLFPTLTEDKQIKKLSTLLMNNGFREVESHSDFFKLSDTFFQDYLTTYFKKIGG